MLDGRYNISKKRQSTQSDINSKSKYDLLRIFARCRNISDCAKFAKVSKTAWNKRWHEVGLSSINYNISYHVDSDETGYHEIAVISDLHMGSKYYNEKLLYNFINVCHERNIKYLLCCGDLTDGLMNYPTHIKDRLLHCAESYEEFVSEHYPTDFQYNGFILGNHDISLGKYNDSTYDFGKELSKLRSDLDYHPILDDDNTTEHFMAPGNLSVMLYHGSSCANPDLGQKREPRLQGKVAELQLNNMSNDVYLFGHCHKRAKTSFMQSYIYGLGCFQDTTPYLKSRHSYNDVCGMILKYNIDDGILMGLDAEYLGVKELYQ